MRSTIDAAGRVVVPKPVRDQLHLTPGHPIEIEARDGEIVIRPAPVEIEVVDTPEGPVATSRTPGPALTDELVRETLERARG